MYIVDGFLTLGLRHRTITLLIVAILSVLAYGGLTKLTVNTDLENLISSNINRSLHDEINAEFHTDNVTVILVQDNALFSVDKLAKLKQLETAIAEIGQVEKIDSLFTTTGFKQKNGQLRNEPIIDTLPTTEEQADNLQTEALSHPLLRGTLLSSSGETTALNITLIEDVDSTQDNLEVYDAIQEVLSDYQNEFSRIYQMGDPRLASTQYQAIFRDLTTISPISIAFLAIVLFVFFLNTSSFILPIITASVSLLWTFGFMGYVGIPVNILIVMLPALIIVMGATEDTHMLSSYMTMFEKTGSTETTRKTAAQFMLKKVSLPVILTAVTTWFGFAVSQFSSILLVKQFAQAASFSFLANAIATILLVPCYLATVGPKPRKRKFLFSPYENISAAVTYLVQRHPIMIASITSLIVGAMLVFAGRVYVNTAPLSFFASTHEVVVDADLLHQELSGINSFFVTLELDDKDAFKNPSYLNVVKDTIDTLRNHAEIDSVTGLSDYIIYINQEANQGNEKYAVIPDNEQQVEQYLSYFREGELSKFVNDDYTKTNIIVRHNIKDSRKVNDLLQKINWDLEQTLPEYLVYHITGEDLLINESVADLLRSQIISIAYLIIAIFILIAILFTSKLAGAIAMLPNIIPMIILFGLMGIFSIPLNPGTTLVAVILISIAVDDTIHLFHAYIYECRHELDNNKAIMKAVQSQIRPVLTTSLALAIGFFALIFSDIKINASFGMLAAISILLAMFCDLLLTPVLLSNVRIVSLYNILSMHLIKNIVEKSLLFKEMSPYEIKKAILLCTRRDYKAGETIIEQGQEDDEMYLLISGQVEVTRTDEGGQSHLITELGAGEIFGEMAYVQKIKRSATVKAQMDTSLILFNEEQLNKSVRAYPHLGQKLSLNIARILSQRLRETTAKLTS